MDADEIKSRLVKWTVDHSGFEDRHYLGMSRISQCPRALYFEVLNGTQADEYHKLMCYAGYLWERDIKQRLIATGIAVGKSRELIARYDPRVVGHTDSETIDGDLIEIKSVMREKFDRIVCDARVPLAHFDQVQMYMNHGNYRRAFVVYVARDTGSLNVVMVKESLSAQDRLNVKAIHVLKSLDSKSPPRCECGRCK